FLSFALQLVEHNKIDGPWGWLKKSVIDYVFYSSVGEIKQAVQTFLSEISKTPEAIVKRLCNKM
ncbi:hypothetical protein P5G51_020230, partial [Virgibacillus sp. 179-BFC.A HS]|nr:hypothetical protein [Virgibacillus sp. 179-BFC.A HS]